LSSRSRLTTIVLASIFLITICTAVESITEYSINLVVNDTLGTYLVNQTGFTLYYFMDDAPGNNTSSCYENCSDTWPPFYEENLTVAKGLKPADFSVINRTDGSKQIAYKGWPLYFYSNDIKPGEVNGQNMGELWQVINPTSSDFRKPIPSILTLELDSEPLRQQFKSSQFSSEGSSAVRPN
jgi:predicted lipoprotein with Yx(FWY)xxD motif